MNCPKCGCEWSTVLDTRAKETYIRRRRRCENEECEYRWSTCEVRLPEEGDVTVKAAVEAWVQVMNKLEGAKV